GGEVDREDVALDDREPRGAAQARREVAVDLDDGQRAGALEQRRRERAAPGTDLDERIARTRIDLEDDPLDDRRVDEEVLAEALPRVGHGLARGYCGGSRYSMYERPRRSRSHSANASSNFCSRRM